MKHSLQFLLFDRVCILGGNAKKQSRFLNGGTLTEVFTRDIEENPFEKGFFLKLLS